MEFADGIAIPKTSLNLEYELELPKPEEIVPYIKSFYLAFYSENPEMKEKAKKSVDYLEELIDNSTGKYKSYLMDYYSTILDAVNSLDNLLKKHKDSLDIEESIKNRELRDIKEKKPTARKRVNKAVGVGLGSLISYFVSNAIVSALNVPSDVALETTGGILFTLIIGTYWIVDKFYSYEEKKVLEEYREKVKELNSELTENKAGVFKRAEERVKESYMLHIEGAEIINPNSVDYISKLDGTKKSNWESFKRKLKNVLNR